MKTKFKAAAMLLAIIVSVSALSSCSMKLSFEDEDSDQTVSEDAENVQSSSTMDAFVSIIQYMDYSSLNQCCEGVKSALDSAGVTYDVTVGSDNKGRDDCEKKAQELVINGTSDLVICIGTPCAEAVYPIISSAARTPVIFCDVTDPLGAGLVENINQPGVNCTGVATSFNITEQLNMINSFQPSITRLGVIYTESEQNTEEQLKTLKKAAEKLGITVYTEPVSDPSELSNTASELMKKVEAVTLLPDNMVTKNSWNVTNRSIVEQVPLYGVDLSEVSEGCLAGYCYDHTALGRKAGECALSVLHGDNPAEMPVIMEREAKLYVNSDRLKEFDMEIPDEYRAAAVEVKTSYESRSMS